MQAPTRGINKTNIYNTPTTISYEIKLVVIICVVLFIIIGVIWYSYKLSEKGSDKRSEKDGFITYRDLVNELNQNRENIIKIDDAQNSALLNIDTTVTNYIDANKIFPTELKDRLRNSFDIRFSQKLQDIELTDLQQQLEKLKQKMSKLPTLPSKYILKNNNGSAFDMLGEPNDFSLRINPNEARCLGFSPYGINNPTPTTKNNSTSVYKSAIEVQCDLGGSDANQRFKITEIKNNKDYNKLVGDLYSVPDYYNLNTYPFMVAQPVNGNMDINGNINECITFDNSGLSVEPCTGNANQQWQTYAVNN